MGGICPERADGMDGPLRVQEPQRGGKDGLAQSSRPTEVTMGIHGAGYCSTHLGCAVGELRCHPQSHPRLAEMDIQVRVFPLTPGCVKSHLGAVKEASVWPLGSLFWVLPGHSSQVILRCSQGWEPLTRVRGTYLGGID